ncbi:MAG: hypothetical protein IIB65_13255 [Proteobacteria bacterium]|nr:hypothetical protein [Pseudomonadota bacterium]
MVAVMGHRDRLISYTYTTLASGALFVIAFWFGYAAHGAKGPERIGPKFYGYLDFFAYVGEFIPLFAWLISPFAVFAVITYVLTRWVGGRAQGKSTFPSALALLVYTLHLFSIFFLAPTMSSANPGGIKTNLVFNFAPFHQFLAVVFLGLICLFFGILARRMAGKAN